MTHDDIPADGLWSLVLINSAIFIFFAFSFFKPQTKRDWRSFGAFSAFIVALFTEMYGFPLTIYLLSGWLQTRFPKLDLMSHDAGHLWYTILEFKGDPHSNPIQILSNVLTLAGFVLLAAAWKVLYQAQRSHTLAVTDGSSLNYDVMTLCPATYADTRIPIMDRNVGYVGLKSEQTGEQMLVPSHKQSPGQPVFS